MLSEFHDDGETCILELHNFNQFSHMCEGERPSPSLNLIEVVSIVRSACSC